MTDNTKYRPPRFALRLFKWYCRSDRMEELEGDLEEFFFLRKDQGDPLWKAQLYYWWNVLRCYKNYSKSKTQNSMTFYPLFKSYFKLAIRHSWKNKWSVLINIIGLGLALSMCIFTYSIYAYNFEFDKFYDSEDIYRINSISFENGQERRNELSHFALNQVLENEIAGVEVFTGLFDSPMTVRKGADFFEESIDVVTEDFFSMFDIPLWYGSTADFDDKPVVFLTNATAKKYFGDQVALGEQFTIYVSSTRNVEVTVAGVFERIPLNSSFDFDMLISQKTYFTGLEFDQNSWNNDYYYSHFIKASANTIPAIEKHLNSYLTLHNENHPDFKLLRFELIPFLSKIHNDMILYRKNTNARLGAPVYIIFTSLAIMIFLIACFNLANSSFAMIAKRLKEIGIRKTLGSENKQIMIQFLFEMGVICLLSFAVGLSLINLTSNTIMGLFNQSFLIKDINLIGVILFILIFLGITTVTSGIMPALYAWKFHPIAILRKSVKLKGVGWISKGLTIAQYSISIAVLSAAITFARNQEFLNDLDVGYANEDIYALDVIDESYFPSLKQRIDQIPGVETVGSFNHVQSFGRTSSRRLLEIDTSSYELRTYSVGSGYLELMRIPILKGRTFIDGSQADQESSIIVNEEFVRQYFEHEDPISRKVKIDSVSKTIIGVYKNLILDVRIGSENRPAAFMYNYADEYPYLIAKVSSGDREVVATQFKSIWADEVDRPYSGNWQKDLQYGSAVRDTRNLRIIFFAMAIIGGILSIAGIFSQAKLNAAKRLKEICIRKVLGSSVNQILVKINTPFYRILSVSLILGCALGYIVADQVLAVMYTVYVSVNPMTCLLSGLFISIVAIYIVHLSVTTPAKANPIIGLRDE